MKLRILTVMTISLFLTSWVYPQTQGWGWNSSGKLGNDGPSDQTTPSVLTNVAATGISGGYIHNIFIKGNGTIWAMGNGSNGQLGNGGVGNSTVPIQTLSGSNNKAVASGYISSASLRLDGTVWSWGSNSGGELGTGTVDVGTTSPIQSMITGVKQISSGFNHTLALKPDGTVWAWGVNNWGQIGDNSGTGTRPTPVQVGVGIPGFSDIVAVSAHGTDSMALKSDGTVWYWGNIQAGQNGNGTTGNGQGSPVRITALSNIVQISTGDFYCMALKNDGTVWIWGANNYGQIGNGIAGSNISVPVLNTTLTNIIEIDAGDSSSYARRKDGTVWAWGLNNKGQIGNGMTTNQLTPFQVPVGTNNASISASNSNGFASKPIVDLATGSNVSVVGENLSLNFSNVSVAGNVSITGIDPTTTGLSIPAGYTIKPLQPAYKATKTASTTGNIKVCVKVNVTRAIDYAGLRILHEESGNLVDRTTSTSIGEREICATVQSLSRFAIAEIQTHSTAFDFDGDSKADISVFRRSLGEWWYLRSVDGLDGAFGFGSATDIPVPADFTGDGIADFSFWRPSTGEWFILRSDNTGFYSFPFGTSGDIPAPGDFDGDGIDDAAIFRPSSGTWYIQRSSDGGTDFVPFGTAADKPLVGDYDGDGKDDVAIYKPNVSQFWQIRSTEGLRAFAFGAPGDQAMVADFSGDGTDDMVAWRESTGFWFVLRSEDSNFFGFPFGAPGDIPAPADYDGDGTADATVFRPSNTTWYSQQSTNGATFTPFGIAGDEPVPGAYVVP